MHWTPIDGTTLLHLAIDFEEREIFEWLLARHGPEKMGELSVKYAIDFQPDSIPELCERFRAQSARFGTTARLKP